MIQAKVKVLIITDIDPSTSIQVESQAGAAGIKVIDYDRVNLGGSAEYYVSFDNPSVGKLQAQGLLDCLGSKPGAQIIMLNGGTDIDNNAVEFKKGAHEVLDPAAAAGKIKIAQEVDVSKWDNATAATDFQQLLTKNGGKVDGVLAANDGIGGAAIGVLKSKNLKVPVTGQDASIQGLQYVLSGDQCMTVFKDVSKEADAASKLAIALIKGQAPTAAGLTLTDFQDPVGKRTIKALLLTPTAITKANVEDVITAGALTAAQVCKGIESICASAGIK
jgi:D-xylose transport system substrate-binding protein